MAPEDESTLFLYGYAACPYCANVLSAIVDLGAPVELRDTLVDPAYRAAVVEATGRGTVPVLRIDTDGDTRWLSESADIITYLYERFGEGRTPPSVDAIKLQRYATAAMWGLLIAGMFVPESQAWLWLGACAIGAARSVFNGIRTKAWFHFAIAGLFTFACVSIVLYELGIASIPW